MPILCRILSLARDSERHADPPSPRDHTVLSPIRHLLEFLVHGAKYAFPAVRGPVTRGHPTGRAAPVLRERIVGGDDLPPVWPDPEGTTRGESLSPLYGSASALKAVVADPELYAAVALVDAIRGGSARERKVASDLLEKMFTRRRAG